MKKLLFVLVLLASTVYAKGNAHNAPNAKSVAVGVFGGWPFQGVTLKINQFPIIGLDFDGNGMGLTLDGWLMNKRINNSPLAWYWGVGGFIRFHTWNNGKGNESGDLDLGVRLPVALQFFIPPVPQLEVFLEVAPGFEILTTTGFYWHSALGVRWHFN